jgi:hypothetical protein
MWDADQYSRFARERSRPFFPSTEGWSLKRRWRFAASLVFLKAVR